MNTQPRVAILWHGDRETRYNATAENNRLSKVFEEFKKHGVIAEPVVYNDAVVEEVRRQLNEVDGVLVWVNPIQNGMNRTVLDDMLRDVASCGVFVSTHPDVILKLGTKEVLFQTREMEWGGDVHLYKTIEELREHLPTRLSNGKSRVLKQNRGNGGNGVWRVELVEGTHGDDAIVRVLHAMRKSTEKQIPISEFMNEYEMYFEGSGQLVDQPFHSPVPDGMVRCYMSHDKVVGFGHQYVTALLRPERGSEPLEPQPRIYHPNTNPAFQALKAKMETEWIAQLQRVLDIDTYALPLIWDADFLYGSKMETGQDTYVLCEVNVSSVYPFPESALRKLVETALDCIRRHRQ